MSYSYESYLGFLISPTLSMFSHEWNWLHTTYHSSTTFPSTNEEQETLNERISTILQFFLRSNELRRTDNDTQFTQQLSRLIIGLMNIGVSAG